MAYVVIGGAGFIGSWVAQLLVTSRRSVVVVDDLSTGAVENLATVLGDDRFTLVRGDAADLDLLRDVASVGDTFVHLAATVGVERVCEVPAETYRNNVETTEAVLAAAAELRCRVFYASTSEVYGELVGIASSEDTPPRPTVRAGGRGAYTLSKLEGERLCHRYATELGVDMVVGRLFNTIGPRQSDRYGMVVPRFVAQALAGEPVTVFGDGRQTRCFCSVHDVARAILALCVAPTARGHTFNIGAVERVEIATVADYVCAQVGGGARVLCVDPPPGRDPQADVRHRQPDITKIRRMTGWRPRVGWRDIVQLLVAEGRQARSARVVA